MSTTNTDAKTGWTSDLVSREAVNKILYDGYQAHLHHCTNSVNAAQFVHDLQKAVTALPSPDFEQLTRLREAAMRFVLDPDNQDCYHDSFYSNSVDWPLEFLQLCGAVAEHCAHLYRHEGRDPTEDPDGYCTLRGCKQPREHWVHINTDERAQFIKDRAALAQPKGE